MMDDDGDDDDDDDDDHDDDHGGDDEDDDDDDDGWPIQCAMEVLRLCQILSPETYVDSDSNCHSQCDPNFDPTDYGHGNYFDPNKAADEADEKRRQWQEQKAKQEEEERRIKAMNYLDPNFDEDVVKERMERMLKDADEADEKLRQLREQKAKREEEERTIKQMEAEKDINSTPNLKRKADNDDDETNKKKKADKKGDGIVFESGQDA